MDGNSLIMYTQGVTTASEKCRDWKKNFIPLKGDLVRLQGFELFGVKDLAHEANATYRVIERTVTQDILYIHLELVQEEIYEV